MAFLTGIVGIAAVIGLSAACAYIRDREFSFPVFLVSCGIGISILVWIPMLPFYFIVLAFVLVISPVLSIATSTVKTGGTP